jgi:hypothetical protein
MHHINTLESRGRLARPHMKKILPSCFPFVESGILGGLNQYKASFGPPAPGQFIAITGDAKSHIAHPIALAR